MKKRGKVKAMPVDQDLEQQQDSLYIYFKLFPLYSFEIKITRWCFRDL